MKRGSMEISFGMIFSVIIIIAIIGVAVYAITTFLHVGKTAELSLFYKNFEDSIEDIWSSASSSRVFSFSLPKTIESVCFGSLTTSSSAQYNQELKDLKMYSSGFEQQNTNTFLYPATNAGEFAFKKVDKIDLSKLAARFDCFEVNSGKVKIRLSKEELDSLVKVEHE